MKKSWKEHYWYTVPVMRRRIEEIVRCVNGEGKSVLEVGCNEGFVSKSLLEDGCNVTSSDISDEMIQKAKDIFGLDVVKADACKLPFEDKSFDIVVAGEVLEHTTNPFLGLSEFFRVAKEKVIITLPVGEYWLGERTHFWELGGMFIEHDSAEYYEAKKDILILSWTRRRDDDLNDIPPFSMKEWEQKFRAK